MKLSNTTKLNVIVACAVAHSDYDYNNDPKYISATTLIKSPRRIVMGMWNMKNKEKVDVTKLAPMFLGNSSHTAVQLFWESPNEYWRNGLKNLGYSKKYINRIIVNPTKKQLKKFQIKHKGNALVVYIEKRAQARIGKYNLTGKYDYIFDGRVQDLKTASVYKVNKMLQEWYMYEVLVKDVQDKTINHSKYIALIYDECPTIFEYLMQGSIYKVLNPDKIKSKFFLLEVVMKDWFAYMEDMPGYPSKSIMDFELFLFSVKATKKWAKRKLKYVHSIRKAKVEDLPYCTPTELWQGKPIYKYFTNPKNTKATKVFKHDSHAAYAYLDSKNGVGVIKIIHAPIKACGYCDFSSKCDQYKMLVDTGKILIKEKKR